MSNSNGMYNVLNIFKKLEPTQEQQVKAEAKAIYESVEAKGSILEGVNAIEQKLAEKYMGFKATAKAVDRPGVKDPEALAASIGRKKYGKKKFQKAAAAGKKLGEQGVEEGEKRPVKGGMVHYGPYGSEFDVGDDGSKKKKAANKNPTGQRGRPKADKPAEYSKTNDLFGRVPDKAPKGKKGTVIKGKGNIDTVDESQLDELSPATLSSYARKAKGQAGWAAGVATAAPGYKDQLTRGGEVVRQQHIVPGSEADQYDKLAKRRYAGAKQAVGKGANVNPGNVEPYDWAKQGGYGDATNPAIRKRSVNEGVNFTQMMQETHGTLEEMLSRLQSDVMEFKASGKMSEPLRDCMSVYEYGKKQIQDDRIVPRGPSFAPQHAEIPDEKPGMLSRAAGAVAGGVKKAVGALAGPNDEELLNKLRKDVGIDEELNELARLAGLEVVESAKSPKADKDYDKDGSIESEKDEVIGSRRRAAGLDEEITDEGPEILKIKSDQAKAQGKDEFKVGDKTFPVKEDVQVDECMSPMGSMASDMEQQQGKISVNTNMSSDGNKSVSINADGDAAEQLMQMLKMAGLGGSEAHTKLAIAVPTDGAGQEVEMDEATAQYANTPEEEYQGVDSITDQGEDLNRQKKQFPKAENGDNPMAVPEAVDPISSFGRDLMAEYQALKKQK